MEDALDALITDYGSHEALIAEIRRREPKRMRGRPRKDVQPPVQNNQPTYNGEAVGIAIPLQSKSAFVGAPQQHDFGGIPTYALAIFTAQTNAGYRLNNYREAARRVFDQLGIVGTSTQIKTIAESARRYDADEFYKGKARRLKLK